MSAGATASMDDRHIPSLDGYRGLAMWMVVAFHMKDLPSFGWIAIQMFFVLSGFLITRILMAESHLPLGACLKLFYWRRALRIMPALYAYLAILFALSLAWEAFAGARTVIPWAAVYVHNLTWLAGIDASASEGGTMATIHLWSLSVEEHFYLLWPLALLLSPARYRLHLMLGLILLAPAVRALLQSAWPLFDSPRSVGEAVYFFSGSHLDAFAMGALATVVVRQPWARRASLAVFALAVAAAATLGVWATQAAGWPDTLWGLRHYAFGYRLHMQEGGIAVWGYTVVNLLCLYLLVLSVHHPVVRRAMEIRFLRWTGKISYSMYLMHFPLLYVFIKIAPGVTNLLGSATLSNAVLTVSYLALIFGLASLSFRYFESYFIRLKPGHRLPRLSTGQSAPLPPARDDQAVARADG